MSGAIRALDTARLLVLATGATLAFMLLATPTASATSDLQDVWCTAGAQCLAVGQDDGSGVASVQARRWNGATWTEETLPTPEGAELSGLAGVACASASACTAVGSVRGEEGIDEPLVLRWDGSSWDEETTAGPTGSLSKELNGVSCVSATHCMAVGYYIGADQETKPLAMSWNGSSWALGSVPTVSGSSLNELDAVSCVSASDCVAVGSFVNASDVTKTLSVSWNGASWSIASTPEPVGAELSQLMDISCLGSGVCTAVGTYFDSTGDQKTLALRRAAGGEWAIQTTPNPTGATRRLTAVSCSSSSACTALGVIEQGAKELPIALAWNGSSWVEQAIASESLGASSIEFEGLSCVSSSDCTATGAVKYGRGTARRSVAFRFNGTTWLVTEEGGYERKWMAMGVSSAGSALEDLSCPITQKCIAVGSEVDDSGVGHAHAAGWDGSAWSREAPPVPAGATSSQLSDVWCRTAGACKASGSYLDDQGVTKGLIVSWNGWKWSLEAAPTPAGALRSRLSGIACVAYNACVAVGDYQDASGTTRPLTMAFDGASWTVKTAIPPPGTESSGLTDVSCKLATSCMAVGSHVNEWGNEKGLVLRWDGSSWTSLEPPLSSEMSSSRFTDVSCFASLLCWVVGTYTDLSGVGKTLAMSWTGTAWATGATPNPEEASAARLMGVSCVSSSSCVAVGDAHLESMTSPLVLRWNGSGWVEEESDSPDDASSAELRGVSCATATECNAAGGLAYGSFGPSDFALSYSDGWKTTELGAAGGELRGVSCSGGDACMAVGDSGRPRGGSDSAMGWILAEDGWASTPTPALESSSYLTDISCSADDACTAVGRRDGSPDQALAERWNGETWSVQSLPAPSGRTPSIEAVSCPSSAWCAAAGFSRPTTGSGPLLPVVEAWNGTSWSLASAPLPAGAESATLADISCTSSSFCVAVGSYPDSGGTFRGLIERWNGSVWTAASLVPPAGQEYRLRAVDCTSSTACTAVGNTRSSSQGSQPFALAARWNGTSWATQSVPSPENASSSDLADVDCYSSVECVSAGGSSTASSRKPLFVAWSSVGWQVESDSEEGDTPGSIEAISCFSAADCVAVGRATFSGRSELFSVATGGDPEFEDPPPTDVDDPEPRLTTEQIDQVASLLQNDPSFQATLGASEYELKIGPWTELNEELQATIVGAFVEVTLEDPASWTERTWPAAGYAITNNGYEEGSYYERSFEAAASGIERLQLSVDTELDSASNVVDGEVVEITPLNWGGGTLTLDPGSYRPFNEAVAGY